MEYDSALNRKKILANTKQRLSLSTLCYVKKGDY